MTDYLEFSERELQALDQENTGPIYSRSARISDRAMAARIEAALKESETCVTGSGAKGWPLMTPA